jgi:hypothetical protein
MNRKRKVALSEPIDFNASLTKEWSEHTLESINTFSMNCDVVRTTFPKTKTGRLLDCIIGHMITIVKYKLFFLRCPFFPEKQRLKFFELISECDEDSLKRQLQRSQSTTRISHSLAEIVFSLGKVMLTLSLSDFQNDWETRRTHFNIAIQSLNRAHGLLSEPDATYEEVLREFQKSIRAVSSQMLVVREQMTPDRCNSIYRRFVEMVDEYHHMLEILRKHVSVIVPSDTDTNLTDMQTMLFDLKTGLLYTSLVEKMRSLFVKLNNVRPELKLLELMSKKRKETSDSEDEDDDDNEDEDEEMIEKEEQEEEEEEEEEKVNPRRRKRVVKVGKGVARKEETGRKGVGKKKEQPKRETLKKEELTKTKDEVVTKKADVLDKQEESRTTKEEIEKKKGEVFQKQEESQKQKEDAGLKKGDWQKTKAESSKRKDERRETKDERRKQKNSQDEKKEKRRKKKVEVGQTEEERPKEKDEVEQKKEESRTRKDKVEQQQEESQKAEDPRSSVLYGQLMNLRGFIVGLDSLNSELPILACSVIYDLEAIDEITKDKIIFAFSRMYGHLRSFLRELNFNIPSLSLFSTIEEIEIFVLQSKLRDGNLIRLSSQLGTLHNPTHHFKEIVSILEILREIEPFDLTLKLQEILAPLALLLSVITAVNEIIKTAKLVRRYDFLSIDFPNCAKRMTLIDYECSSFHRLNRFPQFDEFLETCCVEIESGGTQILISHENEFDLTQIIIPNILLNLLRLHELLSNIPSLFEFREDLLIRPLSGRSFFEAEQTLAKQNEDEPQEASELLRQFRRIHHFLLALDYRKIISYSNAVMLMYFRTFVLQFCCEDYLSEQRLIIPLESNLLMRINRKVDERSIFSDVGENVLLRLQLRLESLESLNNAEVYTAFFLGQIDDCDSVRERISQQRKPTPDNNRLKIFIKDIIETEFGTTLSSSAFTSYAVDYISLYQIVKNHGLIEESIAIDFEDFEMVFPVHFSSLHFLDLQHILSPIETNLGEFCEENSEYYSDLSHIKRGCFSSEMIGGLTSKMITVKKDILLDELKRINLFIIFLDFVDEIASQCPQLEGRSLLREMNVKNFCGSMVKRFLFLNSSSRMELPSVISQLRSIVNHSDMTSTRHLQGLFTPILRECVPLNEETRFSLTARFKKSPEDNNALLDLTFGCLGIEIRNFLEFLENPTHRFCHPSGAFLLSTDFDSIESQRFDSTSFIIFRPIFPVPFTLLDVEAQDEFVCYLERLERERESFIEKELELQRTIEERRAIENALIEVQDQRTILINDFESHRKAISSSVVCDQDRLEIERSTESPKTREEMQISLNWQERRLSLLKEHREIIESELENAKKMKRERERELERFQTVSESRMVSTVQSSPVKGKKKGIDRSQIAILPEGLSEHMRSWNKVTTSAVEKKVVPESLKSEDPSGGKLRQLKRRLSEIDAVLAKLKV